MRATSKLFMVLAMLCGVACTTNTLEESVVENNAVSRELPNEINVSFDDATSRIQLDEQCRTTWTEDDEVSVFYFSDANNRFLFMGDTGDRNGALVVEDNRMDEATAQIDKVVLVYPYSDDYKLNATTKSIGITIPGTQYYLNGSYGVGANIMTSVGTTNDFALKSVCGWIKVQLTGAASVTEVTLTGNNKEQLAGDATLYYEENRLALLGEEGGPDDDSQVGGTLFFGEYVRTITLDCGEGIALDSTTPTEFYFVLAPQTFDEGITIKATLSDGTTITKSTSKSITIERNVITPMASFDVQPTNEIWYTSTDGEIVVPEATAFSANIISNTYENGKGIIKFDGDVTSIEVWAFGLCTSLTSITIPESVTEIGYDAFSGCSSLAEFRGKFASSDGRCLIIDGVLNSFAPAGLTEYTIPEGVTSIGKQAFINYSSLTSITIPDSVTSIGQAAFANCTSLTSVTIGNGVTSIGKSAFDYCTSLASITIPDSVTWIGDSAFCGCSSLASITIPDSVTSIGDYVFLACSSLASVTIPDSVTSIGGSAFADCASLAGVTIGKGITSIGSHAFSGCSSLTSITIPDSVTEIGEGAFCNCSSLAEFKGKFASSDGRCLIVDGLLHSFAPAGLNEYAIPDSVTSIGSDAFYYCSSLTSITIPDSVTSIGDDAFYGCKSLASITIPDSVTSIGEYTFYYCSSLASIYIPDSVTSIGRYAFQNCSSLTSITIPDSVTEIGENAFCGCTSLTSITIPEGVTSIGGQAFCACSSLASITIPEGVTSIGDSAFWGCTSLTSVTIPDSVTSIGWSAFRGCSSLTSVYCKSTTPPSGQGYMFDNNASGRKIYVPTESVDAYKTAKYWSNYADAIEPYVFE